MNAPAIAMSLEASHPALKGVVAKELFNDTRRFVLALCGHKYSRKASNHHSMKQFGGGVKLYK